MTTELGRKLDDLIMEDHWKMIEQKPYPMFKGLWENRFVLPAIYQADFEGENGTPLEIPLVGGGYIKLGREDTDRANISVDINYPTARGEMREEGFIVTDGLMQYDAYPFWIFYDDHAQDERMKFLSRMKPEKDIDWEKIKSGTVEFEVAKALCKYKEFEATE